MTKSLCQVRLVVLKLAVGAALAMVFVATPANASVIINVTEVSGNVVFSVSGSLDLTGAIPHRVYSSYRRGLVPGFFDWYIAPGPGGPIIAYDLTSVDRRIFGTSLTHFSPSSFSGDDFFIWEATFPRGTMPQVAVSSLYVSGSPINSGMIFNGATIAGFTLIPGTYTYTIPNDTISLNIGSAATSVPEASSLLLVGTGLLLALARKGLATFHEDSPPDREGGSSRNFRIRSD